MASSVSSHLSSADQRLILEAFEHALSREAHNLLRWPELMWQQLYNDLQWEQRSVIADALAPEFQRRTTSVANPWLHTRALHESRSLVRVTRGHEGAIESCSISSDGALIVSGGEDETVRFWDSETGEERANLRGHDSPILACAISPDGSFAVAAGEDKILTVWDIPTGRERATLRGHGEGTDGAYGERAVLDCAVLPDGSIVSAGKDGTVRIWDPRTGRALGTLRGGGGPVNACAVSPDGSFLVSAEGRREFAAEDRPFFLKSDQESWLRVWNRPRRRNWRPRGRQAPAEPGAGWAPHVGIVLERLPYCCAVSPDGSFVVSGGLDGTVRIWDAAEGEDRATLRGHHGTVDCVALSPDGSFVVSGGADGTVRIWGAAAGEERAVLRGHQGWVSDVAISPDGSFIVSASRDGTLRIWDPVPGEQGVTPAHKGIVMHLAFSPDGSFLASAGGADPETLAILEPVTGEQRFILTGQKGIGINEIEVSSDASYVMSRGSEGTLRIWDPTSGEERHTLGGRRGGDRVSACALSPDGTFIVSAGEDGTVRIWDAAAGEERTILGRHKGDPTHPDIGKYGCCCAVSPDGCTVVSGYEDTVRIWDTRTGEERASFSSGDETFWACAVSPDGSFIVSGGSEGTVRISDLETGEVRAIIRGHDGSVGNVAVSPDGTFVISSGGGTVGIWDPGSGDRLQTIRGEVPINVFAMSATGSYAATANHMDRRVWIWNLTTGKAVARIPLPADVWSLAGHPWLTRFAAGDRVGNLHILDIQGVAPAPIPVTATHRGGGLVIRCPACFRDHPTKPDQLGGVTSCPTEGCGLQLRINPFVVGGSR